MLSKFRALELLLFALLCSKGCCHQSTDSTDFDGDLASWARLKRDAGYFTSSYRYRGGLYKRAKDTELEFYHCSNHTNNACLEWTVYEQSVADVESGHCRCQGGNGLYCSLWRCTQTETLSHCDSEDDCPTEETLCFCDSESQSGRYCAAWSCTEKDPDGTVEHERYRCLRENESRDFCQRWSGDIESDKEIESSVCGCEEDEGLFCSRWTCKERGIIKCDAFGSGWCRLSYAIGIGGGLGLAAIVFGLILVTRNPDSREKWLVFLAVVAILCLPWTAGVLIWGGVEGLGWVALMWGGGLIFSFFCLCNATR